MFLRFTKRKQGAAAAAFIAIALLLAGCSAAEPVAEESGNAPAIEIKTEAAAKVSMGEPREQVAEVSAAVRLDIPALASGKVVQLLKKNGDSVKAGEVIAKLESRSAELQKKQAAAGLSSAQKSLEKAKVDQAASRAALVNSIAALEDAFIQASSQEDQQLIDAARRNLESAKQQLASHDSANSLVVYEGQVDASKVQLEQADLTLESFNIAAPAAGTLTDLAIAEGMAINGGTTIAVVQNVKQLKIKTELSEPAAALARGKKELLYYNADNPSDKRKATIVYLSDVPNAASRMYALELTANNSDGAIKPGERVHVQLTTTEEELVVAVPSLSVVRAGSDTFIYISSAGVAEKRAVKLGRVSGIYQEVLEGLKEGETVVVSGQHSLKDGQSIQSGAVESK
ncbi:efflux RND transporter periplasmic adaptor subunit [Paenibacillus sp. PL91]|uniref:efflux RND transporter periplasmic adaptor subunit n=1 Tax=Paenibacillus sp. PL91 TaxID=2729538 RepID=UPI00145E9589|nr:efflux RND transporter periplasmic adaptor subunit [Paenibacillus sp. PL91]MBC9201958.1 efflux RND transporter periplasmic adaptor subunit [Paenibacillus sp. PL91]